MILFGYNNMITCQSGFVWIMAVKQCVHVCTLLWNSYTLVHIYILSINENVCIASIHYNSLYSLFIIHYYMNQRFIVTRVIGNFTARSSYASAVLGIVILSCYLSVHPSVCPSITRVVWDKTVEHSADILIPHERVIIPVFWYQRRLVGDVPSAWNLHLNWPTPLKSADFNQYLFKTSEQ